MRVTLTPAYWATIAQVLPVVAVATVVEARAVSSSWEPDSPPKEVRRLMATGWFTVLVLISLSEPQALAGLRGEAVPRVWATIADLTATVGLSFLVIIPALDALLQGFAEPIARVFTSRPMIRLAERSSKRDHRRQLKQGEKQLREFEEILKNGERRLAELKERCEEVARHEEVARRNGYQLTPEESAVLTDAADSFTRGEAQIAVGREVLQQYNELIDATRAALKSGDSDTPESDRRAKQAERESRRIELRIELTKMMIGGFLTTSVPTPKPAPTPAGVDSTPPKPEQAQPDDN